MIYEPQTLAKKALYRIGGSVPDAVATWHVVATDDTDGIMSVIQYAKKQSIKYADKEEFWRIASIVRVCDINADLTL